MLKELARRVMRRRKDDVTPRIDTRGIPVHECFNCGSTLLKIVAYFEDYDIAGWLMDAECANCGAPLTAPCPVDNPGWTGPNPFAEDADDSGC